MNNMTAENCINSSSESDSGDELDELVLLYSLTKRKLLYGRMNFRQKEIVTVNSICHWGLGP